MHGVGAGCGSWPTGHAHPVASHIPVDELHFSSAYGTSPPPRSGGQHVVVVVVLVVVVVVVLVVVVVVPVHGVRSRWHESVPSALGVSHGQFDGHEDASSDHSPGDGSQPHTQNPDAHGGAVVVVPLVVVVV